MGTWVSLEKEKPPAYGEYNVRKRGRGRKIIEDRLLWNGAYFVTHGHGPCSSVEEWWDEEGYRIGPDAFVITQEDLAEAPPLEDMIMDFLGDLSDQSGD